MYTGTHIDLDVFSSVNIYTERQRHKEILDLSSLQRWHFAGKIGTRNMSVALRLYLQTTPKGPVMKTMKIRPLQSCPNGALVKQHVTL